MRHRSLLTCALVLLTGFGLQQLYLASFELRRWLAREEMEERLLGDLPAEQLTTLTFTTEEFATLDWEEEGWEFELHGRFFDVVRTIPDGSGTLTVLCVDDADETRIMSAYSRARDQDGHDQRQIMPVLVRLAQYHALLAIWTPPEPVGFTTDWPPHQLPTVSEPSVLVDHPPRV